MGSCSDSLWALNLRDSLPVCHFPFSACSWKETLQHLECFAAYIPLFSPVKYPSLSHLHSALPKDGLRSARFFGIFFSQGKLLVVLVWVLIFLKKKQAYFSLKYYPPTSDSLVLGFLALTTKPKWPKNNHCPNFQSLLLLVVPHFGLRPKTCISTHVWLLPLNPKRCWTCL